MAIFFFVAENVILYLKICENFLHTNFQKLKIAKISFRKIFLFYSTSRVFEIFVSKFCLCWYQSDVGSYRRIWVSLPILSTTRIGSITSSVHSL